MESNVTGRRSQTEERARNGSKQSNYLNNSGSVDDSDRLKVKLGGKTLRNDELIR